MGAIDKAFEDFCREPQIAQSLRIAKLPLAIAYCAFIAGEAVCREGWNGRGQCIRMQMPDANSKMTQPYVFIRTMQGDLIPWLASQADLLAIDWRFYEDPANF